MVEVVNFFDKVKEEFHQNGISGVLGKAWHKTRRFMFYSTCSVWFERELHEPVLVFTPDLELETDFLVQDKSEIFEWLENNKTTFPWIFSEKEIDSAQTNNHPFFAIKHRNHLIGYLKIGVGPTYIHDFDKTVRFEPRTAFIYDTLILPEYRKMNLAVFSINETARYFKEQDFNRILCHIDEWNISSIKVYEKAGFKALGSIRFIRMTWFSLFLRNGYTPFLNLEKYLRRYIDTRGKKVEI